jgi:threonine dehydrogenase-like Zn-dependent dehydrogenase
VDEVWNDGFFPRPEFLRLLEHGRVNPTLLTTRRFTFTEVDRALHPMDMKEDGIIKLLITFGN